MALLTRKQQQNANLKYGTQTMALYSDDTEYYANAQNNNLDPYTGQKVKGNTGANRGAVGSLGQSSTAGLAGNSQAGLVGSVNTEVQNDDSLLPYQKV
tara:strand:- start:28 stop:321 length:294 start_codon:yes stop_codon:yes gene_type:complete